MTSAKTPLTAIVTGASGNLGRAVAQYFYDRQYQLVLVDHGEDGLKKAFSSWDSSRTLFSATNLLDAQDTQLMASRAIERFGQIDVLCNLVGGFLAGPTVAGTPEADWQKQYALNVLTVLHGVQAVVPHMEKRNYGKIINVGAYAANHGVANMGAYIAAKSAVIRMTESMGLEQREKGINVNCVLPTVIDTPQNRQAMPDADPKRWVAPAQIADVIGFLASDAASAVFGAAVPVNGLS